jgi:hypothetical protein
VWRGRGCYVRKEWGGLKIILVGYWHRRGELLAYLHSVCDEAWALGISSGAWWWCARLGTEMAWPSADQRRQLGGRVAWPWLLSVEGGDVCGSGGLLALPWWVAGVPTLGMWRGLGMQVAFAHMHGAGLEEGGGAMAVAWRPRGLAVAVKCRGGVGADDPGELPGTAVVGYGRTCARYAQVAWLGHAGGVLSSKQIAQACKWRCPGMQVAFAFAHWHGAGLEEGGGAMAAAWRPRGCWLAARRGHGAGLGEGGGAMAAARLLAGGAEGAPWP